MNYRLYRPDDFAELYAIEEVCFRPPLRFERDYMMQLICSRTSATWIAEEDGAMAGFAIVEWRKTTLGTSAYIPNIEVLPGQRGRGVGRELLRRLEESARAAGATAIGLHVDIENAYAIRLYESQQYSRLGVADAFYSHDRPAFVYKKDLSKADCNP